MTVSLFSPSEAAPGASTIEAIFHALESPLLAYALRLLGNAGAAEDVVQEAFMKLHAQTDPVLQPKAWLYRTVHNLALNHRRKFDRIVPMVSGTDVEGGGADELSDPRPLPDEEISRWEGIGLVRLSLETLDEESRNVVRLRFEEGLSYKEIGEKAGLTVGNVGYLLHHALKKLAGELAKAGLVP
jgi:RNA polymerase sigma factor (sigma-70 family)